MARLPGGRPFEEFLPCEGQVCKDNRGYITACVKATSFPGPAGMPRQKFGGKTRPRSAGTLYDEARILPDSAWWYAGMLCGSDAYIRRRRISAPLQASLELPLSLAPSHDERRCLEGTH